MSSCIVRELNQAITSFALLLHCSTPASRLFGEPPTAPVCSCRRRTRGSRTGRRAQASKRFRRRSTLSEESLLCFLSEHRMQVGWTTLPEGRSKYWNQQGLHTPAQTLVGRDAGESVHAPLAGLFFLQQVNHRLIRHGINRIQEQICKSMHNIVCMDPVFLGALVDLQAVLYRTQSPFHRRFLPMKDRIHPT